MGAVAQDEITFGISEAVKFFEGRTVQWMRWRERTPGLFTKLDQESGKMVPIQVARTTPRRAKAGYRKYTLENLADIAAALLRERKITQHEYNRTMAKIEAFQP